MSNFDSNGVDASLNSPALPGNLLATIPANLSRHGFYVQNQDAADLVYVVFDVDGSGTGQSILVLAPAAVAGGQGGAITFTGMPHTGVIRIFGTNATTKMAARAW